MIIKEIQFMIEFEGNADELEEKLPDMELHNYCINKKYELIDIDYEEENLHRVVYSKETK